MVMVAEHLFRHGHGVRSSKFSENLSWLGFVVSRSTERLMSHSLTRSLTSHNLWPHTQLTPSHPHASLAWHGLHSAFTLSWYRCRSQQRRSWGRNAVRQLAVTYLIQIDGVSEDGILSSQQPCKWINSGSSTEHQKKEHSNALQRDGNSRTKTAMCRELARKIHLMLMYHTITANPFWRWKHGLERSTMRLHQWIFSSKTDIEMLDNSVRRVIMICNPPQCWEVPMQRRGERFLGKSLWRVM